MSEPIYSRAPDVVWRLGPDRVLVQRIGRSGGNVSADLMGGAAVVWLALDEPGTRSKVRLRISDLDLDTVVGPAIDQLFEAGLIVVSGMRN